MNAKERFMNRAKAKANKGCPLLDNRESMEWDEVESEILTLDEAYPLSGAKGDYYCVSVVEYPEHFFFSGKALNDILDEAADIASEDGIPLNDVIKDVKIHVGEKRRTKNGNKFRVIEICD